MSDHKRGAGGSPLLRRDNPWENKPSEFKKARSAVNEKNGGVKGVVRGKGKSLDN